MFEGFLPVPDGPAEYIFEGFLPFPDGPAEHISKAFLLVPDGPAEHIFEGFLPVPDGPAEHIFEGFLLVPDGEKVSLELRFLPKNKIETLICCSFLHKIYLSHPEIPSSSQIGVLFNFCACYM